MIFKHKKDIERVLYLHPIALIILFDMHSYCLKRSLPFVVTATVTTQEEDEQLNRQSSTHREGRAFDLSIQGWTTDEIDDFMLHFQKKYDEFAAKKINGEKVLIPPINHGTAPHFHVQISRAITSKNVDLNKKIDFLTRETLFTMLK